MGSTSAKRPLSQLQISDPKGERLISKPEFQRLAEVPPEVEWFANLTNENTRRAYRNDVTAFMRFVGIKRPEEFRAVTRAHVIAWRKILEQRKLAAATGRSVTSPFIRGRFNFWRITSTRPATGATLPEHSFGRLR